ncbi:MAG: shikimate dehydrogenase [Methanobacteriota archaeon]|nr:MAG: shikimate dehydrogenase [Euryarchaeota archaeon]
MMTLVVASLVERGIAGVSRSSKKAFDAGADLVEVRLDHLRRIDDDDRLVHDARAVIDGPAIATLRSEREGGKSRSSGGARRATLREVVDAGYEYIDLESARDGALLEELQSRSGLPKTISSFHYTRPAAKHHVKARIQRACSAADIAKVAVPCADAAQAVVLAELALELRKERRAFAIIGIGVQGQLTRACSSGMGSMLVYACVDGKEAAPGQLDVRTQSRLLEKDSVILGLIGHPVAHSVSRPMQEAALKSVGLNGIYLPLDIPPKRMTRTTVNTLFDIGFDGLNVTVPNKRLASRMCDLRRPHAVSTDSVNTLLRRKGKLVGENSDTVGFEKLLSSEKVAVDNASALVIGAGGAARAACWMLRDGGADVTVSARRIKPASEVAGMCGGKAVPYSTLETMAEEYDIVVNATPIGTKGTDQGRKSLPKGVLANARVLVDLVYNPPETPSMRAVRKRGRPAHGGLEMLVRQGEEAFIIWTGLKPDVGSMRRAARRAVGA